MQQQMCQPDQNGHHQQQQQQQQQQAPQQMMLCPVNVVYETQILVQPGDQIQPNQTFFINPQNPPPWMQNRPQNQMIYVQQLPNNIVPSVQQHTDQNQYYVQQNFPYQQMIQQQIIQNPQEAYRQPMQMPNVIHVNMFPNMPIQNDRVAQMPNFVQNVGANPGTNVGPNIVQNQMANNRQIITNVDMQNMQNMANVPNVNQTQKADIQRQIYMNQQANMIRANQQIVHNVQDPNIGQRLEQVRPIQQQQMNNAQPVYNTIQNIQMVPKPRTVMGTDNKIINTIPNPGIRNTVPTYSYRPIQPRPQFRPNTPNMLNMAVQTPPQIQVQKERMKVPYIKTENIRKRKSESPDEIQKKIATPQMISTPVKPPQMISTPAKPPQMIATPIKTNNSNDIGVNTSPVHRIPKHIPVQTIPVPIKMGEENKTLENKTEDSNLVKDSIKEMLRRAQVEKMIRNTVFTQARGRVLNDKEISVNIVDNTKNDVAKETTEQKTEIQPNIQIIKTEIVKPVTSIEKPKVEFAEVKKEIVTEVPKIEEIVAPKVENKEKVTEDNRQNANKSINELRRTETHVSESPCREEKDYILTHVLDGYVIQESNIAFPIRKPLKEKTLDINLKTDETDKQETKPKENAVKDNSKILVLSSLRLDEEQNKEEVVDNDKPFGSVLAAAVKAWTVDQLASHLSKYNWKETINVLREHEIDGESLFLVSKSQLVHIGVSEDHADIICEFVKA